ncbi:MAG TPA: acyl-CoA reductase [Candidatus Ozemobacteraceae bacterium]|nr:acyl-CoA reductase [Candidatus Ozemobacteraceae bacterium]
MKNISLFGTETADLTLHGPDVPGLLAAARERAAAAASVPIHRVVEILDRVAGVWADPAHPLRVKAQRELPGIIGFSPEMVSKGLDVVAGLCRHDATEARIYGEIGELAVMDDWVTRVDLGYDLRAVPRGVILHLAAGNVFVGAVDSLLAGILTKNANILKMSHADPLFPRLFMQSLRACDPDGLVWPNQAVVAWKGGDGSVEQPLLGADLTIVFWGGREALAAVRSRIGPGTQLVENGPRYSFAVTDAETVTRNLTDAAVRGLALDLCAWDQQACSSPHVVYVIGRSEKPVLGLMNRLVPHLESLTRDLPPGPLGFDEKVEIRRVRELTTMAEAKGRARLVCPETFGWTLIYEKDPVFKVSCLNRTLFFKAVPSVERLIAEIAPMGAYLQTVGLEVEPARRPGLEEELLRIGAKRLTGFGGMCEGKDGAPHEGSFLLSRLVDWVDREHRGGEDRLIGGLLDALKRSAYYGPLVAAAEKAGTTPAERLAALPLLDRETFYRHSPPLSRAILTGPMTDAYVYASGGTTGEPKFALYSNEEYRIATDVLGFIYATAGLGPEDIVGNLFLAGNLWTSFNVAGRALENIGCLNMPIGGATDYATMIKFLQAFDANAVVGLPSIIIKLAEEVERRGSKLRIRKVLYGGEHLRAPTVEYLKRALGCEFVRSAGYACVDTGPVGYQCPHLGGALHHVLDGYQLVEIIEPETGVVRTDDQPGEIVATGLTRHLMPVVRYRTGDLGRWADMDECACGFAGRTFELLGRCDDLIVIGGINLMPSDVAPGLATLAVSQNFQIVARQKNARDHLLLRLEAEKPLPDEAVVEALKQGSYKIAETLNDRWLTIEIEWFSPGGLPRNPRTGKIKTVIDERGGKN